jgi:hypothetical protein
MKIPKDVPALLRHITGHPAAHQGIMVVGCRTILFLLRRKPDIPRVDITDKKINTVNCVFVPKKDPTRKVFLAWGPHTPAFRKTRISPGTRVSFPSTGKQDSPTETS